MHSNPLFFTPPGIPRSLMPPCTVAAPSLPRRNDLPPPPLELPQNVSPLPERNEEIANKIGGYWESRSAKDLFAPSSPDSDMFIALNVRVELLESVINSQSEVSEIVNRANENNMTYGEAISILQKCFYLRCAYVLALDSMGNGSGVTWKKCCKQAIKKMRQEGLQKVSSWRSISRWNRIFRTNEIFPHPNVKIELKREYSPLFLELYPEAKDKIREWGSNNLQGLTAEKLANYVRTELVVEIHQQHVSESNAQNPPLTAMTIEEFKRSVKIREFCVATAWKYMKFLLFKWDERRKTYYSDKHESEENVRAREEFTKKYMEYEKKSHVWIQLTKEQKEKLENDAKDPLLPNISYQVDEDTFEFHIDSHPSFYDMEPQLSVRMPENVRPVIIAGQDESVIKQNIYPNRTWYNHLGACHLLPKTDGQSKMISAYTGRKFGLGLHITDEQFEAINDKRTNDNSEWKNYVSEDSAMEVYGSIQKKKLTSKHVLIQNFDFGVNQDGFWSYHHMALQNEDAFDILSVVYPYSDFVILMDQSSGHTKKRENGLDVSKMSKNWGGNKDHVMRSTTVREVGEFADGNT